MQAELAKSGLERPKSHPARLTKFCVYAWWEPDYPGVYRMQTETLESPDR